LTGINTEFKVLEVTDCAVSQGKTYTYVAEVEIDAGKFTIGETTKIRPKDEGKTLEMDFDALGIITEKVEDPSGVIENGSDRNEFEGVLKNIGENSFTVDVEGYDFEIEHRGIREEWPDLGEGNAVRFGANFYP
jgi:hypothetical protein